MSTTTIRKPRKRPAPSARDQEIYVAWSVSGKTQSQLAQQHGLQQCRISQIIRRVAVWRGKAHPGSTGECTEVEQQRLNRWLEHERLHTLFRESLQNFHKEQRTVKTTKTTETVGCVQRSGTHQSSTKSTDETLRELPANVQWLKTALRAQEQLSKLEDKEPLPAPELSEQERLLIMRSELIRLRKLAEDNDSVPSTNGDAFDLVDMLVDALLGNTNGARDPAMIAALRHLSRTLLPESDHYAKEAGQPREAHAPAEPSDDQATGDSSLPDRPSSTLNLEPETLNAARGPSTFDLRPLAPATSTTSASTADSSQLLSPDHLSPKPASKNSSLPTTQPSASTSRSTPPKSQIEPSPAARRLAHDRKLEQLKEARRLGLPYHFVFDPEDGPLPPPPPQPGDYHIVVPGPY